MEKWSDSPATLTHTSRSQMVEKSILQSRSYTRVSNVTQKQSNEIYSATTTKRKISRGTRATLQQNADVVASLRGRHRGGDKGVAIYACQRDCLASRVKCSVETMMATNASHAGCCVPCAGNLAPNGKRRNKHSRHNKRQQPRNA